MVYETFDRLNLNKTEAICINVFIYYVTTVLSIVLYPDYEKLRIIVVGFSSKLLWRTYYNVRTNSLRKYIFINQTTAVTNFNLLLEAHEDRDHGL